MTASTPRRRVSGNPFLALAIFAVFGTMLTVSITFGVWPGEARYTAPILCPDHQPDAFVVEATERISGNRTARDFSMFCVGPRGDWTEIGFMRPFLVLVGVHTLLLIGVAAVVIVAVAIGSRGRRHPPTPVVPGTG